MKKALPAVVIGALLVAGATYVSPHVTLYQMKSAIDDKDADAFSENVDFPALRESVKGQMMASMQKRMASEEMKDNPFAAMGAALGTAMVGAMVDNLVAPAGVIAMMQNGTVKPVDSTAMPVSSTAPSEEAPDYSLVYRNWKIVDVQRKGGDAQEPKFVFKRHGLWSWKLSGIDLPLDAIK
jgi:hypothetical protein